jgi:predicted RNA-binding Zn ribbon-like protein
MTRAASQAARARHGGEQPGPFNLIAGHLALDFVNTVANRLDPAQLRECLTSSDDLSRWLQQAGIALSGKLRASDVRAAQRIREQLHALFVAIARGQAVDAAALRGINTALRKVRSRQELVVKRGRIQMGWSKSATALQRALLPVLSCAVELLQADLAGRIRECEGAGCGWLFLDRSRGQPRRWCDMRDCGNRAKARRHYHKDRQQV